MKALYFVTSFFIVTLSVAFLLVILLKKQNTSIARIRYTQHADTVPISVPVRFDKNGVYVADLTIDSQPVSAVVDTGSAHMLVAGSDCNTCMYTLQNGTITPSSSPKQSNDHLKYGSQNDTIDWYDGTVQLGHKRVASEYALVRSRTGSSSYNVMGIGRVISDRRNFLSYLNLQNGIITFETRGEKGKLLIGGDRKHHPQPQYTIPMLPSPYYRIAVQDVRCGNIKAVNLPIDGVIFDTGSNMMDVPPRLFRELEPGLQRNQPLELVFGSRSIFYGGNVIKIKYLASQYRWYGGKLLIGEGKDSRSIVLGSLFMKYLRITFDLDREVMGFSQLPS